MEPRLSGSQRTGLALAGVLIGLLLLWVGVEVYVREARLNEAELELANRLQLPRSAFELEEVSEEGTVRVLLRRLAVLDPAGDTILAAPTARLFFQSTALGGTGPIRFDRLDVEGPSLRLIETPSGEWNLTQALRVEADGKEVRFSPGADTLEASRPLLFRDVRITNGRAMIATAVQSGDSLPALFASRGGPPLMRIGGRTMLVRRARDIDARLASVRVGGTQGWRVDVESMTAEVSNPDLRVAQLRGWIEETGPDRFRFDLQTLRTPYSTLAGAGTFRLGEAAILWDVRLRAAPLDFRDLRGLGFGVPEGGRATFTVDVESLPGGRVALRSPDAVVTTSGSRVEGRFAATVGGGRPWAFSDTRLSLEPLDFATVNQLGFAEIPYEGEVRGTVSSVDVVEEGREGHLRIDLTASFRPPESRGEPSVVVASGDVAVGGEAPFRLEGVRIEARPVYLASLAPLVQDPAQARFLRGVLRGSAVATGTPADLRVAGGTVTYEVGDAPPTRIADLSARISTEPALRYEVEGRAAPLALATLTEMFPQLPFRTATLSGPFSVSGTAERASFDVDFHGSAGRFAARGSVAPGEPLAFDVTGEVEAFRSGLLLTAANPVQGPLSGSFSARGSTEAFRFDVDLRHEGGSFVLGGQVRNPGDGLQFDVAGQVYDFRLGTVLGRPDLFNSPLTGSIALSGGGRQPYSFDVDLTGPVGLIDLKGWYRPGEIPSYYATGRIAGVNPRELPGGQGLPAGNLNASLLVEGRGTTPETFEGRVDLSAQSSTLDGAPLDAATVRLEARGGILQIDTLAATFRGTRVAAAGAWGLTRPAPQPLRFSFAASDLSTLAPLLARYGAEPPDLAGSVNLEGWLSGTFRAPAFNVSGSGTGLRYGAWRANQLALQAQAALGVQGWTGFGNLQADGVLLAGREELQNLRLEANASPGLATFGVFARRDQESDLAASGTLLLEGRELRGVELQSLALRLSSASWQLLQPSRLRWGGIEGLEIERLALRRVGDRDGTVELDGRLPPTGNTDLRLTMTGVQLSDLRRITSSAPDVAGTLNLTAVLEGPVGSPEMTIVGSVDSLTYEGVTADRVAVDARYAGRQLVGTALVRLAGEDILTLDATVPMRISLGGTVPGFELLRSEPLRARLAADSVPMALIAAAVPALEKGEGVLSANALVTGTLDDPSVNGWAGLNGGAVTVVPLGERFTDIVARIALRGEEVRIDTLTVRSDGTASLSGRILLDQPGQPRVSLNLTTRGFNVIDRPDLARLKVTSELALAGRFPEATLSGRLVLEQGMIRIPTLGDRREAAIVDAEVGEIGADTIPESVVGTSAAASLGGLRISSLRVVVEEGVWLESDDARIQIRGDLLVTRTGPEPRVYGDLEAVRGTYTLRVGPLRREFDIERGVVQFYGTPDFNPSLDILAVNRVRTLDPGTSGATLDVQVQVGGTLQEPTIRLSSNTQPPLPESELLSYLIFGRSTASLGGNTGAIAQQILAQELFGGLVAAELEQELSRSGLVDYVRVRSRPGEATTPFGFGGALGVVGLSAPTFEFGWELSRDLFLTAEVGFPALDQSPLFGMGLDYEINERTRARIAREAVRRDVFTRPFYNGPDYQWTFDVRHRWEWGRTPPDSAARASLADSAAAAAAAAAEPGAAQPERNPAAAPTSPETPRMETPRKEEEPR